MKTTLTFGRLSLVACISFLLGMAFFLFPSHHSEAAVSNWIVKAHTMVPRSADDYGSQSFRDSLKALSQTGVNYVALVVPYYQSNTGSTDIQAGWNTPTDASLISAIDYAHSLGLKVMLKIHHETYSGGWRANINPPDRQSWFNNYWSKLSGILTIAKTHPIEILAIGTEMVSLTSTDMNPANTQYWVDFIAKVRQNYSGKVTYVANYSSPSTSDHVSNEKAVVGFWPQLDYISLSAYITLSENSGASVETLKNKWNEVNNFDLKGFQAQYNKPIIIGEIGYRSIEKAYYHPWDYGRQTSPTQTDQANSYEALLSYWNGVSYFQGVAFWDWNTDPNVGGSGDTSYTPHNKAAETVMKNWFSGGVTPPPPPPPPVNLTFTATGTVNPTNPQTGTQVTLSADVKNTSGTAAGNVIVDLEIYDTAGNKLKQQAYEHQDIAAGQTKPFTTSFTPTQTGNYVFKVGVFNDNWTTNYYWNNNLLTFTVGNTPPPPPPPPPPPANLSFSTTGTVSPGSPQTGNTVSLNANVKNTSATSAANIIVDLEIYNGGTRIKQQAFEQQSIGSSQTKTFTTSFTPSQTGNYTFKVGVFNNNWTTNYYWGDSVVAFTVGTGTTTPPPPPSPPPPPPPTSGTIDVWWPSNGAAVSGVIPFKALLTNNDIATYKMYWQVDNGALIEMGNSSQDYPHKESLVDVSGWRWREHGPYAITFIAKDSGGTTLAQKTVSITVNY